MSVLLTTVTWFVHSHQINTSSRNFSVAFKYVSKQQTQIKRGSIAGKYFALFKAVAFLKIYRFSQPPLFLDWVSLRPQWIQRRKKADAHRWNFSRTSLSMWRSHLPEIISLALFPVIAAANPGGLPVQSQSAVTSMQFSWFSPAVPCPFRTNTAANIICRVGGRDPHPFFVSPNSFRPYRFSWIRQEVGELLSLTVAS